MKILLNKLIKGKRLTTEESRELLLKITNGEANDAQIVAAITSMIMRNVSVQELIGFRQALLGQAIRPNLDGSNAIDVCGTGGDSKNTFNISTISAIVIATAGYKVINHGNYGVSSFCGSSTVLEGFGYQFTSNELKLQEQLDEAGICFLHAPLFHPCLSRVGQIRKDLGVRTFFNFLGPLVNPVQPAYQLTGVYNLNIARMYRDILSEERKGFRIVHSLDGYDEVSLTDKFKVVSKLNDDLIYPDQINQKYVKEEDLHGGNDIEESKDFFLDILSGRGTEIQQEVVIVNAAYGIQCFDENKPFSDCYEEARIALQSGEALVKFKNVIALSKHELVGIK